MCHLLNSRALNPDLTPDSHVHSLSSLPGRSILQSSSELRCWAQLVGQQIVGPEYCPRSICRMVDSTDRMTLDSVDNLSHVSLCPQHFYDFFKTKLLEIIIVELKIGSLNLHSDFSIQNMIINISGGYSEANAIHFENAWIGKECDVFGWATLSVWSCWIYGCTEHIE